MTKEEEEEEKLNKVNELITFHPCIFKNLTINIKELFGIFKKINKYISILYYMVQIDSEFTRKTASSMHFVQWLIGFLKSSKW